ncbi:MAG: arginine--tRNA ligase [Bacteroidales bacterium]|nr:arginine--tRNA ligase [Bacteroidales bacterium]MCF8389512.1 arginine--tRNA ligase [Bacteroidales bacterium]
MKIEDIIYKSVIEACKELFNQTPDENLIQLQKTKKEFTGDFTLVVFPLVRMAKKSPEQTADEIGKYVQNSLAEIESYNVIKGFLNLTIAPEYWMNLLTEIAADENYGVKDIEKGRPAVMVEFSSPNTNKPLHLGHVRNNLLGYSISNILAASGRQVLKVNLVNDRGIHICKSMLAWQKSGKNEVPSETKKGDKLVGEYYVAFDKAYKLELAELEKQGFTKDEAEKKSSLMREAREMLMKWEAGDEKVLNLWRTMNAWVYEGFDKTYERMGVSFDKIYYESETYKLGKELVENGLKNSVLVKKDDNSIWADLTEDGLDSKILLRSDGTSVYMTQDLGTAHQRFTEFDIDEHIYVVGNEQNYHFQVLALILKKLGFDWAERIFHLSYGMVELPEGKMKSREGTVVDADDLMDEMISTAKEMSEEMGKLSEIDRDEKENIFRQVGLGALKYFILKVDPKKNMTFNPAESIDFNGNTGPFIQYTHARIRSILRKAEEEGESNEANLIYKPEEKETSLIKLIYEFPDIIDASARELSPALIANYMYEVAKEFNQFYHEHPILKAENESVRKFRLELASVCSKLIYSGMGLLGIEVPERM